MRLIAAASSSLRAVLGRPAQRAEWLGVTPAALYLAVAGEPGVLAVLAHDAVRLPFGLLLASTGAELPLTALAPSGELAASPCLVGDGMVTWTGPDGPVIVRAVREWAPARAGRGRVAASALGEARRQLGHGSIAQVDSQALAELSRAAGRRATGARAAVRLLGRGPGLTPSGDDVLAGYLVGGHAFGLDVQHVRRAVGDRAHAATTALSAALLWHAARGECVDELAALAGALTGRGAARSATRRLLAVGHTSGAALAAGLVLAAEATLREAA